MKKTILLFGCCLLGWGATPAHAQHGFVAAGGKASGTGGSVSYSIGQIDYKTTSGTDYTVNEGLQQPFEVSVVGIDEQPSIQLTAAAYPNPATQNLTLQLDASQSGLYYQLFDNNGKLLSSEQITSNKTVINMCTLATSEYFLKVINTTQTLKTFKIFKSN